MEGSADFSKALPAIKSIVNEIAYLRGYVSGIHLKLRQDCPCWICTFKPCPDDLVEAAKSIPTQPTRAYSEEVNKLVGGIVDIKKII